MSLFLGPGIGSADWRPRTSSPPPGPALPASLAETGSHSPVPIGDPLAPLLVFGLSGWELAVDPDPWALDVLGRAEGTSGRQRTEQEEKCGRVIKVMIGTSSSYELRDWCRKPWCEKCGRSAKRVWPDHARNLLTSLEPAWLAYFDTASPKQWATISKRTGKRAEAKGARYFHVSMDNGSHFVFASKDLTVNRKNGDRFYPFPVGKALALLVYLLAQRPPDVALARKPSASDSWAFPDPLTSKYEDSGPADEVRTPVFGSLDHKAIDKARAMAEERIWDRLGVAVTLGANTQFPPELRREIIAICQEVEDEIGGVAGW